jgi:hypothetical protein
VSRLIFSLIAAFHSSAASRPISSTAILGYQPFGDAVRFKTQGFSEALLCWKHSRFSVDNSVRLDGGNHTARQALAQYEWFQRAKPAQPFERYSAQ